MIIKMTSSTTLQYLRFLIVYHPVVATQLVSSLSACEGEGGEGPEQ